MSSSASVPGGSSPRSGAAYRNQAGGLVAEVLTFEGDQIVAGHGTYLDDGQSAGGTPVPAP